jgi:glycine/D-amino acid oxidase-like deaminating enzyme
MTDLPILGGLHRDRRRHRRLRHRLSPGENGQGRGAAARAGARSPAGSTWHAAGLVGQLRTNANITRLLGYSIDLYDRLEAETGQATGWKQNGGLRLACTPDRWIEVKRQATTARSFGLEMQLLSPKRRSTSGP